MTALLVSFVLAQARQRPTPQSPPETAGKAAPLKEEPPVVVTTHQAVARGKTIQYTSTTGMMPLRNDAGEIEANVFYVAYTLNGPAGSGPLPNAAQRPLTFAFNGGPGAASVWLHMGAIGPRRVKLKEDGSIPQPPFQYVNNDQTWLDQTDVVFIDPVGTGYSRAASLEVGRKFWSVRGDIESVGEFIRLYLTRNQRWGSPLFVVGESYGTTRAAGLSGWLTDHGIALNGVMLISTVLNFQTLSSSRGNDLPYILYLPTYTATAWYHHKLPPDLQKDMHRALAEVEKWALTDYASALARGDSLPAAERQAAIDRLSRYTGLDKHVIDNANLRIDGSRFEKELLRERRRTIGRFDGRLTGTDPLVDAESPESDPSLNAVLPAYTSTFSDYVRRELGYSSDQPYYVLGGGLRAPWDYGTSGQGYLDTSEPLRSAMTKNPFLKLFLGYGYYDLATPYLEARYTLDHLHLEPNIRANIRTADYEAGHMMYIDTRMLEKLRTDVGAFIQSALPGGT